LRCELTAARLRDLLDYDPETGLLSWRGGQGRAYRRVGTKHPLGYLRVCVDGRDYLAHRLAWLHVHGEWPPAQIDHRNGCRQDNRIANLRLATNPENHQNRKMQRNNTSGWPGVREDRPGRWIAKVKTGGKYRHLGTFATFEEARDARIAAKAEDHQFQPTEREPLAMSGITG